MDSQKQKRDNGFNKNRNGLNDEQILMENDINQETMDIQQQLTAMNVEPPGVASSNTHQGQVIELNGVLYVPLQQEHFPQQKKINKQVKNEFHLSNMMNHRIDNITENNINHVHGNTFDSADNHLHLQEKSVSTPKRNSENLNRSNEQRKKVKQGDENRQQQSRRYRQNVFTPSQTNDLKNTAANHRTFNTATTKTNNSCTLPIDQLRRAVGGNLPCFMIEFDNTIAPRDLPSAIIACELIQIHFNKNNILINGFSVVSFTGHRLKLGVDNMEDYSLLARTEKWPSVINGKKITVIKPKFVPDCFTLVVRYIPQMLSLTTVSDDIKRSISSADNFKQIVYSFNRPTNDFRFTVANLVEYEGALKLGKLSIANHFHPITRYLPANKLTFCTNCWQIGHTRASCLSKERKCRICLKGFDRDHINICSGKPLCAQCGLAHHSLDPNCEYIQRYRQKLNYEVKQAVNDGTINRRPIKLHQQQQHHQTFFPGSSSDTDYPTLPGNNNNLKIVDNKIWPRNNSQSSSNNNTASNNTITSMLIKMNQELKQEMMSMKKMFLDKVDAKLNVNSSNIQLHQVSIRKINSTITDILKNVLIPLINIIPDSNNEIKAQISTAIQVLEKPFFIQAEHVRTSFNPGRSTHQPNSVSLLPPTTNSINQLLSTSPSNDTPTLMEEDDRTVEEIQC